MHYWQSSGLACVPFINDYVCAQVQAIAQPIHSSDWALNRAREAAESLKADFVVIDQTELHIKLQVRISMLVDKIACIAP